MRKVGSKSISAARIQNFLTSYCSLEFQTTEQTKLTAMASSHSKLQKRSYTMRDTQKLLISQQVVWCDVGVLLLQNYIPASTTLETWDLIMRSLSHSCSSMASSPVSVRYTFTCPCSGHQAFKRAVYRPVSPVTTDISS